MKRFITLLSCVLAVIVIASPIGILSFAGEAGQAIVNAVDFSDLPVSDKAYYQKKCALDTESDIFKLGIMLDSADTIGIGEDKTNFKGFYARDNNGDGLTDTLTAASYNNKGMRFTLGVDLVNDWSNAEALVLHIDNSVNSWSLWQSFDIKLITSSGEKIALKPQEDAADINAMFVNDSDSTLTNRNIGENGYAFMPGNKSGYVIIPVTAFENGADLSNITAVSFDLSSKASLFTSIKTIGFTESIDALLGELVGGLPCNITLEEPEGGSGVIKVEGIASNTALAGSNVTVEATADTGYTLGAVSVTSADGAQTVETEGLSFVMPDFDVKISLIFDKSSASGIPSRLYGKLLDLSVITAGDYRALTWDCMLNTSSELYTKGVVIDREPIGAGEENVNFHGFWADDLDGDTVTDRLRVQTYNDKGMRFTLGFNNASALPEEREALLIKVENPEITNSSWNKSTLQAINLTLRDSEGGEYPLVSPENAGESIIKIVDPATFEITEFSPKQSGNYNLVPMLKACWLVIPMDMFEGLKGDEALCSLSFEFTTTWEIRTSIYEIGITGNAAETIDFLTGKAERYTVEALDTQNGTVSADITSAKEGTTVGITASPDEGYILESVTVTEKESGEPIVSTKTGFVMPACDVVISAAFKESPYKDAQRLEQVYTVTQDFSTAEIADHVDWIDGPDLTPLIEQGVLIEDLERGFKDAGVNNSYNGNGIYVQDDGLGFGTSLRLWTHDNKGLSLSLKSNDVLPDTSYEGVVLHLHTDLMRSDAIPSLNVTLYKKKADGTPDLANPIRPKAASALYGTTVWLVNDETGEVTERPLGYSPEQGATMTDSQKHYSQYLVPDGFSGYVLIPFSYFAQSFDASEIAGIRINYGVTAWYMYSNIYDVGFTPSISNFVRIASLGNYSDIQLLEGLYDLEPELFERYTGAEKTIKVTVLKDLLMYYMWSMSGLDIEKAVTFDPAVSFGNGSTMGVDKFYSDAENSVYVELPQQEYPGKMQLTLDVSWDFYDGTYVSLFSFDPISGKMTALGQEQIVDGGFITFDFTKGGKYLLAIKQLTPIVEETQEAKPPQIAHTVTNTTQVEETTGHYETVSGDKKYKTVRTMRFIGYETWFIVLIIVLIIVVLAAALTTVIIIKKKRRKNNG